VTSIRLMKWFFVGLAIYAAAVGLYLWANTTNSVPEPYLGSPADPTTFLSEQQLKQSIHFAVVRNWLFFISYPWEWGLYIVLLFGGFAGSFHERLKSRIRSKSLRFAAFVLWLKAITLVVFLPIQIIGYSVSKAFGVSTQTVPSWIRDKLIAFGINYVLLLVVSGVALWVIARGGRWWLRLWLLAIPFILFMMYIQPVVIDPLYNDFTRLSNPELEQKIVRMAAEAGIPADRVYEVNMSEKTNSLNAYVNGIGGSLRIVLWDTTLQRLTEVETLFIMAHEMGHYVMHHLEYSALGAVASAFIFLWLGSRLLSFLISKWGRVWGVTSSSHYLALPVILLILSIVSFAALPISNYVSRQAESAADRYAFQLTNSTEGAASMYQKLAISSLSDVNPPILVKWFRSTHPSLMERIVHVDEAQTGSPK
jgi:STE24 endopeptidase